MRDGKGSCKKVHAGDVWEFDNRNKHAIESHCVVLILRVIEKTLDRLDDEYEYVVIETDDDAEWPEGSLQRSPLTMLERANGAYWRRLG